MRKCLIYFFLACCLLVGKPTQAQAMLLGDQIFMFFASPGKSDIVPGGEAERIVEEGWGDIWNFTTGTGLNFTVNPEDHGIFITFGPGFTGDNPFEGLLVYGVDNSISDIYIETNIFGGDDVWRMSYFDSGLELNWTNLVFNEGSYFNAYLYFNGDHHVPSAPEASTIMMLGAGAIGLMSIKKKIKC